MSRFSFSITGARVERYAVAPTLQFRLAIEEEGGERVHAMLLGCQIQVEARRRHYLPVEQERLQDLFGEASRWGETLRSLLWTHVPIAVPGFMGRTEIDVPLACSYDDEVSSARYMGALEHGEIPLLFQFSGSAFMQDANRLSVHPVPWDREASFRLPVATWHELMERYYPGSTWVRLRQETLDALRRFRQAQGCLDWDATMALLLDSSRETTASNPAGAPHTQPIQRGGRR